MESTKTLAAPREKTNFVRRALEGLGGFCIDRWVYFAVFFLSAGILFGSYAFFRIHPIGDGSVLVLDLNGQYVYYYEHYREAFWGRESWIYSWSRNLSGEMFGIFAYYLASPYMIIIALLPRRMMQTAILILQLSKVGTSAVTFCFFLKKISPKPPKTVSLIIFPMMYALMSYMVVQLMDPMWLDGLIYLPLICHGVHRLVEEGKFIPYIVPLALMFIAHFYIGYMVGIFTFFYFCYVCLNREDRVLPKRFVLRCLQFGVGTIVALMCAMWVLLPVYNSLKLGKFEFT
ncbi:MAG: YfhO family protein, partial [Ruminococcus sp.]|nr:YfhO family protein [Ruminococcus sp.]